jgi:hypothetical protein
MALRASPLRAPPLWQFAVAPPTALHIRDILARRMRHTFGGVHGRARSAIAPPWFCDELGAGDGCRGHHFFNPGIGMQ